MPKPPKSCPFCPGATAVRLASYPVPKGEPTQTVTEIHFSLLCFQFQSPSYYPELVAPDKDRDVQSSQLTNTIWSNT